MAWNNKYKEEDLRLIPSKPILSDFGKAVDVDDRVELHIFSQDGATPLYSDLDVGTYKVAEGGILDDGSINSDSVVFLDIHNDVRELAGSGTFVIKYNFFRTVVGTSDQAVNDLFIDEISASRKEIRLKISSDATQEEMEIFEDFADKLSIKGNVDHWVDIHVNFGNGVVPLAVNWELDKVSTPAFPYSIVLKLYDPLPANIQLKQACWIVQELITSVQERDFVESLDVEKQVSFLKSPNFSAGNDNSLGPGTSQFYNWKSLTDAKEGVLNKVLNRYFSSSLDNVRLNVDYRKYEHFIRFGSAEERLKNFRYKLSQLEFFDGKIATLTYNSAASASDSTSSVTGSYYVNLNVENFKEKKNDIVAKFDGYESFLYNESASAESSSLGIYYPTTWPKVSDQPYPKGPYTNASVTSSQGWDWYNGAIASASLYDNNNIHSLQNTAVPLHIHEDPTLGTDEKINGEYIKFVDMVGQFFDNIYLYVTAIPETWDRHNAIDAKLIEGQFSGSDMMSKDLIYMGLKSLGYNQCLKSNEQDLWQYVIGTDSSGSFGNRTETHDTNDWAYWDAPDNQFASGSYIGGESPFTQSRIYASDFYQTSHSISSENIRLEQGKRLLNNLPHLLKTKGTVENLKAYMNIYGIPQTLFRIKEWGSNVPLDYFGNEYYEYDSYNYSLHFGGESAITSSWDTVTNAQVKADNGDRTQFPDSMEFRFKLPDMIDPLLQCGKSNFTELKNNANKKDMVVVQINSSSFIAVEHASKHLPSGSETYSFSTEEDSNYGRVTFALKTHDYPGAAPYFHKTSTDWAPIYDGDWWNVLVRRNSPTATAVVNQLAETFTYDVFCKKATDWSRGTITHAVSASLVAEAGYYSGVQANRSWNSDGIINDQYVSSSYLTPENSLASNTTGYAEGFYGITGDTLFIGGNVTSPTWGINSVPMGSSSQTPLDVSNFSGSLQEFRIWMKPLSESAFNNHVLNPMAIDGNTYTSSYTDLIVRYSLGADLQTYALNDGSIIRSSHPNQDISHPFNGSRSTYATASGFAGVVDFHEGFEKVATIVPNYIGMTAREKIRIVDNELDGNLSYNKRAEITSNVPKDINRVSIQMTPVDQINIDMEHQLGGIEFNDLVGDPRAKYRESYPDVVFYDNHYWLKHFGPFKYAEFFKLIRFYDDTVLCQMKKNIPGRSKPDFNIAIEPHILERPRIPLRKPSFETIQLEGKIAPKVRIESATTELGRFKHNGPGDAYYSDWDNRGPLESRNGDLINPSHRIGSRDQSYILPQQEPSYGFGGQREREKNIGGLLKTSVGEIEAKIKHAYTPIIKDDISMCWERDQHDKAARYEWHIPYHWSGSFGDYKDYTVNGTISTAATKGKTKISLAGTFPGGGGHYEGATIILTATNGTIATFTCDNDGSPSNIAGSQFGYSNNPTTLAGNIAVAIGGHPNFTVGAVYQNGTILDSSGAQTAVIVVPVTQSTAGGNGNTTIDGSFFPPYDYDPTTGQNYTQLFQAHSASRFHVFPDILGFSQAADATSRPKITALTDSTRTYITQANAYHERDVFTNVSHPMDPRENERFYDFNKNVYLETNLHPNKPMFNRPKNYPILNNGLTSYADNQSCRDRGKEWFFPFIGNQRESFYKFKELHRFATELSQSLGIKVPRVQYGQIDIGYGNLNGQSIVSHSGAPIQNLAATSVMSESAQYQDFRPKGLQNLIYDGCTMSSSDFNVDSSQTIDGGPVVEVIDTTPFAISATPASLGEGAGSVGGEGIGRGLGSYSGRPASSRPLSRTPVTTGGRYNYLRTSRTVPRGNQVR